MSNNIRTVSGSLSNDQRALMLRRFFPRFDNVFCVQITWAYNVPQDFDYPRQMLDVTFTGHHIGDGHEALVGRLSDPGDPGFETMFRPDGKPIHLTLATAPGVPPVPQPIRQQDHPDAPGLARGLINPPPPGPQGRGLPRPEARLTTGQTTGGKANTMAEHNAASSSGWRRTIRSR